MRNRAHHGESLRANEVSGPRIKKEKIFTKAFKCLPIKVPEQLSRAVMSAGSVSITALSVQLAR